MARLHKNMHEYLDDGKLRKLRESQVKTVFDFLQHDSGRLAKITDLNGKHVQDIKNQLIENFGGKIESGAELRIDENIISTGISSLDELLDGGLREGDFYEFCGSSSSGKTQLCLSIAINVILENDCYVRYIDTKKDFSGSRVQMILEAKNQDDEKMARVMSQIQVTRVSNVYELFSILYDLTRSLKNGKNEKSTKVVVIDSLPAVILSSSKNTDNHRYLSHIMNVLKFLSNDCRVIVITCNLVSQWRENEGMGMAIPIDKPIVVKPTLGKFWLHAPDTRLRLEKLTNEGRKISVWKSCSLKIGTSCNVSLSDAGFT